VRGLAAARHSPRRGAWLRSARIDRLRRPVFLSYCRSAETRRPAKALCLWLTFRKQAADKLGQVCDAHVVSTQRIGSRSPFVFERLVPVGAHSDARPALRDPDGKQPCWEARLAAGGTIWSAQPVLGPGDSINAVDQNLTPILAELVFLR
jgi:hypothetical protein